MFIDTYVTCLRNGTAIQQHIPIMTERMRPSEATDYKAKDPTKAVWIYTTGANYDVKCGDWLVEEKDNPIRYSVLADAEAFPDLHDEIPAERV